MRTAIRLVALAVALAAAMSAGAQGPPAPGTVAEVRIQVKQYKVLPREAVYRAAVADVQADVSFQDAYGARIPVPPGAESAELDGYRFGIVAAFQTRGDLVCLVPSTSTEALSVLFGVPPDTPLTPQLLALPIALNDGQQIVVEGRILGTLGPDKMIFVEGVYHNDAPKPASYRGVEVSWLGAQEPVFIGDTGTSSIRVPCLQAAGTVAPAEVQVEAMPHSRLLDRVAQISAELEGAAGSQKTYGEYDAGIVYRHVAEGNAINVDFSDSVLRVLREGLPAALTRVPALRGGVTTPVPVGLAFQTDGQITCLVPADVPALMARARTALTGERVRVRGNTVGRLGPYAAVLVDYVEFPDQGGTDDNWVVTLKWPETRDRRMWDYGTYEVIGLPTPGLPGRFERLQVVVGRYRTLRMVVPAAPGV